MSQPLPGTNAAIRRPLLAALGLMLLFTVPALIGMWRQPFWIDEAITLFPVDQSYASMADLVQKLSGAIASSVSHTPLHTLMTAAWAGLVPPSEFLLRLMNVPVLLVLGWVAWIWSGLCEPESAGRRWALIWLMATSPFFIYYSYDFRPYALLILAGALMANGLLYLDQSPRRGMWLTCGGVMLAFMTQPTVALVVPWLAALIAWQGRKSLGMLLRQAVLPVVVCCLPAAVAGVYYLVVARSGGMVTYGAPPSWGNFAFVFYEFIGFLGVGPTREQLRAMAPPPGKQATLLADVRPAFADFVPMIIGAALLLVVAVLVWRELRVRRAVAVDRWPGVRLALLFGAGGAIILMFFFRLKGYRFLPRHVSFLFAPVCWPLLSLVVRSAAGRTRNWLLFAAVLAFNAYSSANLLFAPSYSRDALRGAVAAAGAEIKAGRASAIFWYGGWQAGLHYGRGQEMARMDEDIVEAAVTKGTGRHEFRKVRGVKELHDRGVAFWILGNQAPGPQRELLDLYAGKSVVVVAVRGTEADFRGLIAQLIRDSTVKPVSLGRFPFVEAIVVTLPSRDGQQP